MKPISSIQLFCLCHFSKPTEDRLIYKTIRAQRCSSILEVGLGDGTRAERMLRVAQKFSVNKTLRYTGVDFFEGRENGQPKLPLRQVYKQLTSPSVKVQLVPGDLLSALSRIANSHTRTDLVLISAGQDPETLAQCWFYFPRMLHAGSQVLVQDAPGQSFQVLSRLQIEKMAQQTSPRRSAA